MSRQAKTLTSDQLNKVLSRVAVASRDPLRDYVIILLSFKAGLRACEIAGLEWLDVTDAEGNIGQRGADGEIYFNVPGQIAKNGKGRRLPMHPAIMAALLALRASQINAGLGAGRIIRGLYSDAPSISPNALQRYLSRTYHQHGVDCTSHSGRRTMLTAMARAANEYGCSLKDVQKLAGHADISTTERYVELSPRVADLVRSI